MYTVWHVDKYKITFKLVINWTNEILYHIVVSSGLSQPGIIDARARYQAVAQRLRNTALEGLYVFRETKNKNSVNDQHRIHLCRTPQPLLYPDHPQRAPPFFAITTSSPPPSSYS